MSKSAMAEYGRTYTGRYTRGSSIIALPIRNIYIFSLIILFGILLLQDSCGAIYSTGGRPGRLPVEDLRELNYQLITEFDIDEGTTYTPGVVQQIVVRCVSGLRYLIQLAVFNGATCSLGKGSEALSLPPGIVAGAALSESYNHRLYLAVDRLMSEGNAWGYAIDDGAVLSYFQLDDPALPEDPDNDSGRRDELLIDPEIPTPVGLPSSSYGSAVTSSSFKDQNTTLIHTPNMKNSSQQAKLGDPEVYPWTRTQSNDCLLMSTLLTSNDEDYMSGGLHILRPGYDLYSPSKMFRLSMQSDCNLVLYDDWRHSATWASKTWTRGNNCYAKIQLDGVFGVFRPNGEDIWYTPKSRCDSDSCWSTVILQVQDDGNLVLYAIDKTQQIVVLWASNTVFCHGGCPITPVS